MVLRAQLQEQRTKDTLYIGGIEINECGCRRCKRPPTNDIYMNASLFTKTYLKSRPLHIKTK